MADTITLHFTRAEALALDALANNSAERLFSDPKAAKEYVLETWSKETAARACDKLREAVLGERSPLTWTSFLSKLE